MKLSELELLALKNEFHLLSSEQIADISRAIGTESDLDRTFAQRELRVQLRRAAKREQMRIARASRRADAEWTPLTPRLSRAARALLGMTQEELAESAGINRLTVTRFEATPGAPTESRSARAIRAAFERQGIKFAIRWQGDRARTEISFPEQ